MKKIVFRYLSVVVMMSTITWLGLPPANANNYTQMENISTKETAECRDTTLNEHWHLISREHLPKPSEAVSGTTPIPYPKSFMMVTFEVDGKYTMHTHRGDRAQTQTGESGTYHYVPETSEVFVFIEHSGTSGIVGKYAPRKNFQQYYRITELTDTTATVIKYETPFGSDTPLWEVRDGEYFFTDAPESYCTEMQFQRQAVAEACKEAE